MSRKRAVRAMIAVLVVVVVGRIFGSRHSADAMVPEAEAPVDARPATKPFLGDALSFHASFDDGTDADFAFDPDVTIESLYHRLAQGESQAGAAGFRGEVGPEEPVHVLGPDACPGIRE